MKQVLFSVVMALGSILPATGQPEQSAVPVHFKTIVIDGLHIFYREAGDTSKPTILLLHGFPSSSYMFRDLINDLSRSYHLVAPDYPGFGQSSAPDAKSFTYSFDKLADIINKFIDTLGFKKFSLYVQDYGGPVGFRIATQRAPQVQSIIVQNANAYNEGLGQGAQPLIAYLNNPDAPAEKAVRNLLTMEATRWQYTDGAADASRIDPASYTLDQFYLDRPGNDQVQLALFRDYANNLRLYESWHAYFRKYQPPTLVISGKNDKIFIAAGATAYRRDNRNAEINLLEGGHFVLEEKHLEAAVLINSFLRKWKVQ